MSDAPTGRTDGASGSRRGVEGAEVKKALGGTEPCGARLPCAARRRAGAAKQTLESTDELSTSESSEGLAYAELAVPDGPAGRRHRAHSDGNLGDWLP